MTVNFQRWRETMILLTRSLYFAAIMAAVMLILLITVATCVNGTMLILKNRFLGFRDVAELDLTIQLCTLRGTNSLSVTYPFLNGTYPPSNRGI